MNLNWIQLSWLNSVELVELVEFVEQALYYEIVRIVIISQNDFKATQEGESCGRRKVKEEKRRKKEK